VVGLMVFDHIVYLLHIYGYFTGSAKQRAGEC